jgi:hypothetical protein
VPVIPARPNHSGEIRIEQNERQNAIADGFDCPELSKVRNEWIALGWEFGEPPRTRTWNPLIKSQLLYH